MSDEEIDEFLNQKLVARLTSIRPDGFPHSTPFWFLWDGEAVWFILGSGIRPRQHISNLRQNPKLSVVIDLDMRPEEGGLLNAQGVTIRGTAQLSTDEALQEKMGAALLKKYFGQEDEQILDALIQDGKPGMNRVVLKVNPAKTSAWDFRKLEETGGGYSGG
jgi:nitroimidazol reductase NimA-like FMN-containing flavoprotein (pyridoxamine 5'-phosphate oxidase superfamily)